MQIFLTVFLLTPLAFALEITQENRPIQPNAINNELKEVLLEDLWGISPEKMMQLEKLKQGRHSAAKVKKQLDEVPQKPEQVRVDEKVVQWNILVQKKDLDVEKAKQNQSIHEILNISQKSDDSSLETDQPVMIQQFDYDDDEFDPDWQPPILTVTAEESNFKKEGFYLLFFVAGLLTLCVIIRDYLYDYLSKSQLVVFFHCLKDSLLLLFILAIVLIIHYIAPRRIKDFFNIYGIYYFVNLDKLIIQFIIFSLLWLTMAFAFSFTYNWQAQTWSELEENASQKEKIYLDYERLYINYPNQPELEPLRNKLQYLVIRQSFIYPSFQPLLSAGVLREDFNFAKYLERSCGKIYASILRINFITLLTIIIVAASGVLGDYYLQKKFKQQIPFFTLGLLIPFLISFLLLWYYGKAQRLLYQFCHYVDSPYDFKLANFEKTKHPFYNVDKMPQPYFVEVDYTRKIYCNRQLNLLPFKSKAAAIQIVHLLITLQTFWFIWFLYNYVQPSDILFYTIVSASIGLSFTNIVLIVPRIIHTLAIVLNLYGLKSKKTLMKVVFTQQNETSQFLEKIWHTMRAHLFDNFRQQQSIINSQNSQNSVSIAEIQKKILKHAFIQIIQNERIDQIKAKLQIRHQELIEIKRQEEIERQAREAQRKAEEAAKAAAEALKNKKGNNKGQSEEEKEIEFSSEDENYQQQDDGQEENIFSVQERRRQGGGGDRNQRRRKKKKKEEKKVEEVKPIVAEQKEEQKEPENLGPSIEEQLKLYEKELQEEIQNIDDAIPFPLDFLGILGSLCGGNVKIWFQLLMAEKYFRFSQLEQEQEITFQDLMMFSEFSQGLMERGINKFFAHYLESLFENKSEITITELKTNFLNERNFSPTEIQIFLRELQLLRPKEHKIKIKDVVFFILDGIQPFPK